MPVGRQRLTRERTRWSQQAIISVPLVVIGCVVLSHYDRPEMLAGLFLMEWILALVVWRMLCPWLGRKSVVLAAVPFVLSFCFAALVVRENVVAFGTGWSGSDDWWYLNEAAAAASALHSSGWSPGEAWLVLVVREGGWTLAGWPFLLALVSSLVTQDASPEIMHAIALSVNATCLTILLALMFNILGERARRFPRVLLLCFVILGIDPLVYSGQALKESVLQLALMLVFAFCVKSSRSVRLSWAVGGLLGAIGVATTRPAYFVLLCPMVLWALLPRNGLVRLASILVGVLLFAALKGPIANLQIRELVLGSALDEKTLNAEEGTGTRVYGLPLIGPIIYYAISPTLPLPWNIRSRDLAGTGILRGVGTVAWLSALVFVLRSTLKRRKLLERWLFQFAGIMFVGLFVATVVAADDPRYKQPTDFYLAMLFFLAWYSSRSQKPLPQAVA